MLTMEHQRILDLFRRVKKKSYFLFGPRSVGKSWWIKKNLPKEALYINLLNSDTYLRLAERPSLLKEMVENHSIVVIDEIQKIPILLDEVHQLIEDSKTKFLLTGSSARRLKRQHANMLGGRAGLLKMFPLTTHEINKFDLQKYLLWGGLPKIYDSEDPFTELEAYVHIYLEQEVQLESNIRNLLPFSRFLKVAALTNGELINFSNVANDSGIPASTVRDYYQILEDTLIGFQLEPWLESKKRKAIQTSKFYFFDTGVRRFILGYRDFSPDSVEWGQAFEHFIALELKAYLSYFHRTKKLYFWRNTSKHEVDFIIESFIAIEVKSTHKVSEKNLKGLFALQEEGIVKQYFVISQDKVERTLKEIKIRHWKTFLKDLWSGKIIDHV